MPYEVRRRGNEWCVYKMTDNSLAGCSPDEAMARQHMAALYTSEAAGHAAAVGEKPCSCQQTVVQAAIATEPFATPFPVPEYPPHDWFGPPTWVAAYREEHGLGPDVEDTPEGRIYRATVTDDGRVGGYFYDKGACLVHMHGACPKPSPTMYAAFHQQDVVLDTGQMLNVGVIGNTQGHASEYGTVSSAQAHYANPDAQMMIVRSGDDERGGWIAGVLVPGMTYGDVALIRRCALSGDWRPMPASWWRAHNIPRRAVAECEGYDCIGPTLVNRPGLPLVRQYARTAAAIERWTPEWESLDDTEGATVKVTIEGEPGPVSEVAQVLQAASPPPHGGAPASDAAPPADAPPADMQAMMAAMDQRMTAVEDTVGQIVAMIEGANQQQAASVAASVAPVPPRAQKVDPGQTVVGDFVDSEKISVPA